MLIVTSLSGRMWMSTSEKTGTTKTARWEASSETIEVQPRKSGARTAYTGRQTPYTIQATAGCMLILLHDRSQAWLYSLHCLCKTPDYISIL